MGQLCSKLFSSPEGDADGLMECLPVVHSEAVLGVDHAGLPAQMLSCGEDLTVLLYDWEKGNVLQQWRGHTKPVMKVKYAAGDNSVWTCSRDLSIKQWKPGQTEAQRTLTGHELPIYGLALNKDDTMLFSGARDTSVRLWDAESGKQTSFRKIPLNLVTDVAWIGQEPCVLQASEDLQLRVWDIRSMEVAQSMQGHQYIQKSCDVSGDGMYFLTTSHGFEGNGCDAKVWDRRQGKILQELKGHSQSCNTGIFFSLGEQLCVATGSSDSTVKVWDSQSGDLLGSHSYTGHSPVYSLAKANGGAASFFAGASDHSLTVFSADLEGIHVLGGSGGVNGV